MGEPVTNPTALRVCTLSGLTPKLVQDKLITLKDIESTLQASIAETEKAITDEQFWGGMLLGAKFIQVAADVAIAVMEERAPVAGKAVSLAYDTSKIVVSALNRKTSVTDVAVYSTSAKISAIEEHLKSTGNTTHSKALNKVRILSSLAIDIGTWWSEEGKHVAGNKSSLVGVKKTLVAQLRRAQDEIRELIDCMPSPSMT